MSFFPFENLAFLFFWTWHLMVLISQHITFHPPPTCGCHNREYLAYVPGIAGYDRVPARIGHFHEHKILFLYCQYKTGKQVLNCMPYLPVSVFPGHKYYRLPVNFRWKLYPYWMSVSQFCLQKLTLRFCLKQKLKYTWTSKQQRLSDLLYFTLKKQNYNTFFLNFRTHQ